MLSEPEQSAIKRSLENILADEKFAGSPQMSAFLRYVVTETLQGNADRIKAYTVAVDALGKSEAFDPQNDPSVRVLAKRLRTCLDQYYERTSNHEKIIEIKAGSYKPIFSEPKDVSGRPADVTGMKSRLAEYHETQALDIPRGSARSYQASVKPALTNSGSYPDNNVGSEEVVAPSGNVATSSCVSMPQIETFNEATSPELASQKLNFSGSSERSQQNAGQPVSSVPTNDQKKTVAPLQNISALAVTLIDYAQVHKSFSSALVLATIATLVWVLNNTISAPDKTEAATTNNPDMYALQLASAKAERKLRSEHLLSNTRC